MNFSSQLIEEAVNAFSKLPGIGKKTALRLVIHLLKEEKEEVLAITDAIAKMRSEVKFCVHCNNVSDHDVCNICKDDFRNKQLLCIVENIRDVISIEATQQFNGVYHVLGGLLAPLDGIGPEQLFLENLKSRIQQQEVEEVIMALNPTIEGDTTMFYISKLLKEQAIHITSIARGVSFGSELEYTDEHTLARSITKRLPIDTYVKI
jgi:recombination protein RecR